MRAPFFPSLLLAAALVPSAMAQLPSPHSGEVLFSRKISRGSTGDQFGRAIDLLGDLDDDGVNDLVVGASHDDDGANNSGSVWILFMNADRSVRDVEKISQVRAGFQHETLVAENWFGKALCALGDLDGDGVEDVAVGAPANTSPADRAVFILFLNTDGTVRESTRISDPVQEFGRALAPVGDLDGDGVTELAIGDGYGRVYLYYLNADGTVKSSQTYNDRRGATPGFDSFYGLGLDTVGDLDGDGLLDLAIGDTAFDNGGTDAGGFYLSLMGLDGMPKSETVYWPGMPGLETTLPDYPNFGREIALLSDLDGNGVRELAVGVSEYSSFNEPVDSGAVYILFRNPDGSLLDHRVISRRNGNLNQILQTNHEFGIALSPIGDWNEDGIDDLAVGARFDGAGAIYLLMMNDGSVEPPVAAASANPLQGPSPWTVQFTDESTGSIVGWHWDFGDGTTSTLQNPEHTFIDPGSYDVTITAQGPGGVEDARTYAGVVTVEPPLESIARFDVVGTEGLAPLTATFTDTSLGNVTSWSWDFGDGATSSLADPVHTYTTPGTYLPVLAVDGPLGPSTVTSTQPIVVYVAERPTADFDADVTQGALPFAVSFTNLTAGFYDSVTWNFGDGTTSNQDDPTHVYTTPGVYTVSLLVGNAVGLDTLQRSDLVTVELPALPFADFSVTGVRSGTVPLPLSFTDQSVGDVTSWHWDFGDGTSSTEPSPSHTYVLTGNFSVTLTVANAAGSNSWTLSDIVSTNRSIDPRPFDDGINGRDSATGTGYILYTQPAVETRFAGAPPTFGNVADHLIAVVNSSGAWSYDNNDALVPFTPQPTDRLVASIDFGNDTATMLVGTSGVVDGIQSGYDSGDLSIVPNAWGGGTNTGEFGAFGTFFQVGAGTPAPAPDFSASPLAGSAPLAVDFVDQSAGATAWAWDFGDGSTSSLESPNHVYSAPGSYTVSLTVTGTGGTNSRVRHDLIVVTADEPVASFSLDTTGGPAPLDVAFTDTSNGTITSWSWDFGDGATSTLASPVHTYVTPGSYVPSLTVSNAAGSDTVVASSPIVVDPAVPVAAFTADVTGGAAPLAVQFTDLSSGDITAWSWDFGDGAISTLASPTHTYTTPGSYVPSLTVSNASGSDTVSAGAPIVVDPAVPVAAFTADVAGGAAPLAVQFTDLSTGGITAWSWDFGDGSTSTLASPAHTYTTPGSYVPSLTVTNASGSDTVTAAAPIDVGPAVPVASFTTDVPGGTAPLAVQFTDLSSGDITAWSWDFGDGATSTLASPAHTYTLPGSFVPSLTVTNASGSDTVSAAAPIVVDSAEPVAAFTTDVTGGTAPLAVQFTDLSIGDVTAWSWDFGDGSTSTLASPAHTYTAPGSYVPSLTVTNASGSDTVSAAAPIDVTSAEPVAAFATDVTGGQAPLTAQFTDLSTGDITAWSWDFGDGGTSSLANPSHVFGPGTYTISLTVGNATASDTAVATDLLTVTEAEVVAAFTSDAQEGTAPLVVQFTDLSIGDVTSWSWDFGDGATSASPSPAHIFRADGPYTVSLTVSGPLGTDTLEVPDAVDVLRSGVVDGSFEFSTPAALPSSAWTVDFGTAHRVLPDGFDADFTLPSNGERWLELSAEGSIAAQPPSAPSGLVTPSSGGAGVFQDFRAGASTTLRLEAAFLLNGALADAAVNDWMAIELSDGFDTHCLYYRDSFSAFVQTSEGNGLPMTSIDTVEAGLYDLFPSATATTVFRLAGYVGNGGDGNAPSLGYVENVRLVDAAVTMPYGCGVNPEGTMTATPPRMGGLLAFDLDNPFGTQCPGTTTASVLLTRTPAPGYPCGSLRPGFGMQPGAPGELLVDWFNTASRINRLTALPWAGPGQPTTASIVVPTAPVLVGLHIYAQGLLIDPSQACGTRLALTNALEVVLGR